VIERSTGYVAEDFTPFMFDGVVAGQHDQANAAARCNAVIGFEWQVLDQFHAAHSKSDHARGVMVLSRS
jgi:hypothetical protein